MTAAADFIFQADSTVSPLTSQSDGSTSNMLLPKVGSALLPAFIVMELLTGGTSLPSPPPSTSISVQIFQTLPRADRSDTSEEEVAAILPELAKSVRSLYRRSGLSWDELAHIFGVSRRTLYNWSTGGKVSASYAQAISSVIRAVHQVDVGNPQLTRSKLLAPAEDGTTLYARLIQQRSKPPFVSGPSYRPDELLAVAPDVPDPTGSIVDFEQLT
jgi:DNA-binding transcriptional regulator YiaG